MVLNIFSINTGDPSDPVHELEDGDDIRDAARGITALVSDDLVISSAALITLIEDALAAQSGIHDPAVPSAVNCGMEISAKDREWTVTVSNAYVQEDGTVAGDDHILWSATFTAVTDENAVDPDVRTLITGDRDPLAGHTRAAITSLNV